MASAKKGTVTWNIPDAKDSKSPRTPRSARSYGDSVSERYMYTDTFEGTTQSQAYSDTFTSDSYSDTFINGSSLNGGTVASENIMTVKSATEKYDNSEIQEATNLETVKSITEAVETVLDVSDYETTAIETHLSETVKTAVDTEAHVLDTIYDVLDTQPLDSYSYTDSFESPDRTRTGPVSDSFQDSYTESYYTESKPSITRTSRRSKFTTFEDLDGSVIAPEYNGKSLTDEEDEGDTFNDEYSYTFEATELSSQVHLVDPEEIQREAELDILTEEAEKDFVAKLKSRLRTNQIKQTRPHHKLEILPGDSDEESEDDYLKHFCKKKIKMMKKKPSSANQGILDQGKEKQTTAINEKERVLKGHVPQKLLERAKMNNIMSAMKKAAQEDIHEPRKCPECRELKLQMDTEDAERRFVRQHSQAVKNRTTDIQVEQHLLKMNSISMIAELARGLPRQSERPEKIMDQLLEPLLGKNVMR